MRAGLWFFLVALLGLALIVHRDAKSADTSICGPLEAVQDKLAEYGEEPDTAFTYTLPDGQRQVRIMFTSDKTYTMVFVNQDGYACTMYNGAVIQRTVGEPA